MSVLHVPRGDEPPDRPTIVGTCPCPVCGWSVTTEDEGYGEWGNVPFHEECIPADLKRCGACGELEEVKRLDFLGNCWRCRCTPAAEKKVETGR